MVILFTINLSSFVFNNNKLKSMIRTKSRYYSSRKITQNVPIILKMLIELT